jgi:hypothetical protein
MGGSLFPEGPNGIINNMILRPSHKGLTTPLSRTVLAGLIVAALTLLSSASPAVGNPGRDAGLYCPTLHLAASSLPEPAEPGAFLGIAYGPVPKDLPVPSPCPKPLRITSVFPGSAALEAGLRPGDILLSLEESPVCAEDSEAGPALQSVVAGLQVGAKVELDLVRDGTRRKVRVRLGSRPLYQAPAAVHPSPSCPEGSSLLETALASRDLTGYFREVEGKVAGQADLLHNLSPDRAPAGNPLQRREFTALMRAPLEAGLAGRDLTDPLLGNSSEKDWSLQELLGSLAATADIPPVPASQPAKVTFPALVGALESASDRIHALLAGLSSEELALLRTEAIEANESGQWNRFFQASLKVDQKALFDALAPLTCFFSADNLARLRQDLLRRFPDPDGDILYRERSRAGDILVGGNGNNLYNQDAALILDLGGDDTYRNNAGGTRVGLPVAIVIDWSGDDRYLARENFSQGAGLLGGGFLVDLGGDDLFLALDGSQGVGVLGVGVLLHQGRKATYKARRLFQGAGQTGLGLLLDKGGDTLYLGGEKGQGFGALGGVGALVDQNGDDTYQIGGLRPDFRDPERATVSMGQGFGFGARPDTDRDGASGGIGLLVDGGGNDTYLADYFAQGSAYYYGLGILRDLHGNDRYLSGRYAQGAGIHQSVGILLDEEGNDFYHASTGVAQGMGHDDGVGFLEDAGGNDRYLGGSLVQGAATTGIGILVDGAGWNEYQAVEKGQGFAGRENGIGILISVPPADSRLNGRKGEMPVYLGFPGR